jgi:hypothetical protein
MNIRLSNITLENALFVKVDEEINLFPSYGWMYIFCK